MMKTKTVVNENFAIFVKRNEKSDENGTLIVKVTMTMTKTQHSDDDDDENLPFLVIMTITMTKIRTF